MLNILALITISSFSLSSSFTQFRHTACISKSQPPKALLKSPIYLRSLDDSDDVPKLSFREENDKPRVDVKNLNENIKKEKPIEFSKARQSATFGSVSIDDLKSRMVEREPLVSKPLPKRTEDLNGINPVTPLTFSIVAGAMAVAGWQLAAYFTANFAISFLTSDLYPVQRMAIVARNLVVGISTLAAAFSGMVCIGLIALGVVVAIGVAKGELDPNKPRLPPVDGQ